MIDYVELKQKLDDLESNKEKLESQLTELHDTAESYRAQATQNDIIANILSECFQATGKRAQQTDILSHYLSLVVQFTKSDAVYFFQYDESYHEFILESHVHPDSKHQVYQEFELEEPSKYCNSFNHPTCETLKQIVDLHYKLDDFHWFYDPKTKRAVLLGITNPTQSSLFFQINRSLVNATLKLYEDIQLRREYESQLEIQATTDPLTALPNRTIAFDRLEQAIGNHHNPKQFIFVLFIDIARFKEINETLGHDAGDEILRTLARRIKASVRELDSVACLGGDEFLVMLENANKLKTAEVVSNKIIQAIQSPVNYQGTDYFISSNIGISAYPNDGENASLLVKNADLAMYQARKKGLNRYQFFTQDMNTKMAQRIAIERGLHKAIERNEFHLVYQPIVHCKDKSINKVEALIRWQSQELGLVSPAQFIPIAEEDSLIIPIGYWVIEQVCKQLVQWQESNLKQVQVAVNLSVRQLVEPNFIHNLMSLLNLYNITTNQITLEVTEGLLLSETNEQSMHVRDTLAKLSNLGFSLSIDDFGTGYSALSYLNQYNFDYLKLDRTFVQNLHKSDKDKLIIDAIVAMAHKLEMKVVAEGIEQQDEYDYLSKLDCDFIQGFLLSKPLLPEDLEILMLTKV